MRQRQPTVTERLAEMHTHLCEIAKNQERDHRVLQRNHKLLKEIKNTMATKEELNAALDAVSTEITKLGDDLAAQLATLEAQIAAGGDVSDSLAKANAIAAKLQAIDDTLPERPA